MPRFFFATHHALVGLHALALAFDDAHVHDHRVARRELGKLLADALDFFLFEFLDDVHRLVLFRLLLEFLEQRPLGVAQSPPLQQLGPPLPRAPERLLQPPALDSARGAPTGAPAAPPRLRTPPAACTAAPPAGRLRTSPARPTFRLLTLRAAAAPARRSAPSPRARRPRAHSRRSTAPRPRSGGSGARPRPRSARRAVRGASPSPAPSPSRDPEPPLEARGGSLSLSRPPPPLAAAIAFSSGSASITMPGPPPYGRSSTVR